MYNLDALFFLERKQSLEKVLDEKLANKLVAEIEVEMVKGVLSSDDICWRFELNDYLDCSENRNQGGTTVYYSRDSLYKRSVIEMAFAKLERDLTDKGFKCHLDIEEKKNLVLEIFVLDSNKENSLNQVS